MGKLTVREVAQLRRLHKQGHAVKALAVHFDISVVWASKIINGHAHKRISTQAARGAPLRTVRVSWEERELLEAGAAMEKAQVQAMSRAERKIYRALPEPQRTAYRMKLQNRYRPAVADDQELTGRFKQLNDRLQGRNAPPEALSDAERISRDVPLQEGGAHEAHSKDA